MEGKHVVYAAGPAVGLMPDETAHLRGPFRLKVPDNSTLWLRPALRALTCFAS